MPLSPVPSTDSGSSLRLINPFKLHSESNKFLSSLDEKLLLSSAMLCSSSSGGELSRLAGAGSGGCSISLDESSLIIRGLCLGLRVKPGWAYWCWSCDSESSSVGPFCGSILGLLLSELRVLRTLSGSSELYST